jgi:hypothetical protein
MAVFGLVFGSIYVFIHRFFIVFVHLYVHLLCPPVCFFGVLGCSVAGIVARVFLCLCKGFATGLQGLLRLQ